MKVKILTNEQYHRPENQNRDHPIVGYRPVNQSRNTMEFKKYQKQTVTEMRPVTSDEIFNFQHHGQLVALGVHLNVTVSISEPDLENGSPKMGDMIARNPDNHNDQWLVGQEYFEKNFYPVADLPNKLTEKDILARVAGVQFDKMGEKTTVCLLTLKNGYEIISTSSCVDPANYNQAIGEKFAYQKALDQVWFLEGYLLQERLSNG